MSLTTNQTKQGQIEVMTFYSKISEIMATNPRQKFIEPVINENLLLMVLRICQNINKENLNKNMYIDKSDDIVNQYNNAYHRTIKMKLVDESSRKYIDFNVKNNSKDSNLEIGDHVGISKYKNIFARGYAPN